MSEASLFDLIIQSPESERPAILDRETAGHPKLRERIEKLVTAHDRRLQGNETRSLADPHLTQTNSDEPAGSTRRNDDHLAGAVIAGKYKLVERIGEGGMGDVWLAQQTEPVKRQVAVKLIKAGMDSKQVLARFEAERQALAMMDHPNIAKVLDGGLHENRPYFVMELVKGVPITEYCDHHKLTPKQRLELFVPVCQAIQHAHQKGVIHRDIKPSNVLIAMYDDRPVPKVIDFGVAKATGPTLTEHTLNTGFGGIVGTPQYMSPEQATFNNLDIDTRSDVYSLGVLLYELLTGTPPFAKKELEQKGLLEILRVVREEEPQKPSTKLSTADALPRLSANRGTEPKKLTGILRNELDWIVMKSLEKDRTRRYETANGFAADVLRYLSGEAVLAHPPSAGYLIKKFVRRYRGQVIAASMVFIALLAGTAGTILGLFRANRATEAERVAKEDAEEQKAKAEAAAVAEKSIKEQAQRRLAQIEKGIEIITAIFSDLNIRDVKQGSEPLESILAKRLTKASEQLEGDAIGDPHTVAELQIRLGHSLMELGHSTAAINLFNKARATLTALLGADHPETIKSMIKQAEGYREAGQLDLAISLQKEAQNLAKVRLGLEHLDTIDSMAGLGLSYLAAGQPERALPIFEEVLKLMKASRGADHPEMLTSMNNLALCYQTLGKLDLALPLLQETRRLNELIKGADHPDTIGSMNNLALGYLDTGKHDLAVPLFEETLRLAKIRMGGEHPNTLLSMGNLATGYHSAGKLDMALPLFEEAVKLATNRLGAKHPYTVRIMNNQASAYRDAGKLDLAILNLQHVASEMEKHQFRHQHAARTVKNLISCQERLGQFAQAETWRRKWLAFVKDRYGGTLLDYAGELSGLGENLLRQKRWTDAESAFHESLHILEKKEPSAWTTFNTLSLMGDAMLGQKKFDEAEPLLHKGYKGMKDRENLIPPQDRTRISEALDRLIVLYTATNKPDEAKKWQAERAMLGREMVPMPSEKK